MKLVQQFGLLDRVTIFKDWNVALEQNMTEVKGQKFPMPTIAGGKKPFTDT